MHGVDDYGIGVDGGTGGLQETDIEGYVVANNLVGDTVETSGRGGVFPKGILIGTVESVQPEESGLSYYAVIKPFVSVDSVSSVSIITEYTDTAE